MEQTYPDDIIEDDISDEENQCHDTTGTLGGHNSEEPDVEAFMFNDGPRLQSKTVCKSRRKSKKQQDDTNKTGINHWYDNKLYFEDLNWESLIRYNDTHVFGIDYQNI